MFSQERHNKIIDIVNNENSISVKELTDRLDFSPATIRADLNQLSEQGLLIRTHGGATAMENGSSSNKIHVNFSERRQKNHEEKSAIARKALQYIEEDICIILDASSTTYELAKLINETSMRLMILTNGMNIANLLKNNPNITTVIIGGVIKGNSNAVEGLLGIETLKKVNIDIAFLSGHAFNLVEGLTDFNLYEVELKKSMIKYSKSVISLMDYTKLEQSSIASFSSVEDIDIFITDSNTDNDIVNKYREVGLDIVEV